MTVLCNKIYCALVKGEAIKKTKTSQKGRKCRYPCCKHTLSVYNHELYCHVHLNQVDYKKKV